MQNEVILVGSTALGGGDAELGGILLANFLRLLGERNAIPKCIILWNEAVKTAVADSMWFGHLKALEERGVRIVSCRTCVEYFGLEGKIAAGEVGPMTEIQEIILNNNVLTV